MTHRNFSLKYGRKEVSFDIPEQALLYALTGWNRSACEDLPKAYRYALDHPIDAPPLREILKPDDKVAIIVSDITRAWQRNDITLPVLLGYLNQAGLADSQISIIIGVGAHRQNSEEELAELCSQEVSKRVRIVNHNAYDTANMVDLGTTSRGTPVAVNRMVAEADRVILTGGVIYHYMAGFGGGRKSILPGVSSLKTIQHNHLLCLTDNVGGGTNPSTASGITSGNPMHEDLMEAAAFVKPDFLINVVPNIEGEITKVFTGNWVSAWQRACQMVERIFGVPIETRADIVIASAGGYPKDINLYQSQKTIDNAVYAMRPGGVAVILAQCPLISDPPEFFDWFRYPDIPSLEAAARKNFLISGWLAIRQMEYKNQGTIILLTEKENVETARRAHVEPVTSIGAALELAYQKCETPAPQITVMPQGANTFPIFSG
jgi:nickel-dependent lactate racemase